MARRSGLDMPPFRPHLACCSAADPQPVILGFEVSRAQLCERFNLQRAAAARRRRRREEERRLGLGWPTRPGAWTGRVPLSI